jgi:sec-independent protein translocase protein TatB
VFDIGATELLLVAIIGLVVVGPERLPRLARSVGLWVKRLRGQVSSIQQDINRELELEDLKRQLEARDGGLKMEDIAGSDPLGLDQTIVNKTTTEKNERSKPE